MDVVSDLLRQPTGHRRAAYWKPGSDFSLGFHIQGREVAIKVLFEEYFGDECSGQKPMHHGPCAESNLIRRMS